MISRRVLTASPSKTFAALAGAFCFGILLGPLFLSLPWHYLLVAIIILAGAVCLSQTRHDRVIFLILLALVFGIFRFTQTAPPPDMPTVIEQPDRAIRVTGTVSGEVEPRSSGQRAVLKDVSLADQPKYGRVLVYLPQYPEYHPTDRLTFSCRLAKPEPIQSFRYDRYLASKDILAICYYPESIERRPDPAFSLVAGILSVKQYLIGRLHLIIAEPHASFLSGLLFGGSSSLSRDLQEDFSRTGTSHILAASGFNVSLISFVFLSWILTTRLGRRKSLILTALLIGVYVIMAGATPAVLRAALMAGLVLVSLGIRRKPYLPNMFLLVLAVLLMANPKILLSDPGFQLSFVATFAILALTPKWQPYFTFLPERFGLRDSFVASLAAITLTLPIVLWHFGAVSLVAPLVNFLILPALPYLMALTLAAIIASFIHLNLAIIISVPAWIISSLILHLIVWYGALPYASLHPLASSFFAAAAAAFIAYFLWLSKLLGSKKSRA
ncbi:ComEC family competence protein [Patescibacteria group bacterium]|nr:ComEC family competence protein [Patescibacteria group bacterium]MBU1705836.1 ComEC family competence protein [Patescibacteria group bacterium]